MKREKFLLITTLLVSLFVVACPKPPEEDVIVNPYEQHPIDWPSLADSPWPMLHHDPQFTSRSNYPGPENGVIFRKVEMGVSFGSVVIGFDSTAFIGSTQSFYSFNYNGDILWEQTNIGTYSTPIVAYDSVVYIPSSFGCMSLLPNGENQWEYIAQASIWALGFNVDKEGNLYFVDEASTLTALADNGVALWQLNDPRFNGDADAAPAFAPDGATLYLQGNTVAILAVDIETRGINWTFGEESLFSSPVIDNEGNLYFIPGARHSLDSLRSFYSINPEGEINWQYEFNCALVWDNTEATIDHDGNVYFATDTLYAFQNDGVLKWKYGFEPGVRNGSSLTCDANNVIYVGAQKESTGENQIMAINPDGTLLRLIRDSEERYLGPAPALADDGTLFFPTYNNYPGKLLIIK